MPTKPVARITAWSFSRWKDYEQCPRKAKYKHVDKLKEPGSSAMQRGSDIHTLAERYLKAELPALPNELCLFTKEFKALQKKKPGVEAEWAFKDDWSRTDWFNKEAWLRIKVDAYAFPKKKAMDVIDHKTGKPKDDHDLQLSLYAMGGFLIFPEVETITSRLWYLDAGKEDKAVFKRTELGGLRRDWLDRVKRMMTDTRFPACPGNYCRWCHFRKSNGGPCEY